jgi:hypothetical protein
MILKMRPYIVLVGGFWILVGFQSSRVEALFHPAPVGLFLFF